MTPEQRAAKELFGFPDYVPSQPDQKYRGGSGQWRDEPVSYNDLVARYAAEMGK